VTGGLLDRFKTTTTSLSEERAEWLSSAGGGYRVVEVVPPRDDADIPATLPRFVQEIMEIQSRWNLWNTSPVTCFEIRRPTPDTVRLQFAAPTKRLERKIRLHLNTAIPGIAFRPGTSGLPVTADSAVGGGLLTLGRPDMFPLETGFDHPPTDNIVASLHRDAFPQENVVIQILFQPVAGRPVREWLWRRKAFKRVGWLKKEKHAVVPWHQRPATKAERQQADAVEQKARNPQFHVSIRFLFVGTPEELVRSRVKEVGGAFNVFESQTTNQYLDTYTMTTFSPDNIAQFAAAVATRRFDTYTVPFRAGIPELAGLVAVPARSQSNLTHAQL